MIKRVLLLLVLCCVGGAYAQTLFSLPAKVRYVNGATGKCEPGEFIVRTDQSPGSNLYFCPTRDNVQAAGSSSGGGLVTNGPAGYVQVGDGAGAFGTALPPIPTIDRLFLTGMNGNVAASSLNLNTSNSPTPGVMFGTNSMIGVLTFTTGSAQTAWGNLSIPSTVPTSLIAEIKWRTADTGAHNVIWNWNYVCSSTSIDAALGSAGTATTSNSSTTNQVTTSAITLSSPSCSTGDQFYFSLVNRGDTETVTTNVDLISLRIHN